MYTNSKKFASTMVWSILGLVFGLGPAIFWLSMLIACFVVGELDTYVITFSVIFTIIGVVFTFLGIKGLVTLSVVSFCSKFFESDPDGIIEMDSVLRRKGKSRGSAYETSILRVMEKGYFQRLSYDQAYRVFELSDRVCNMEEYRSRFIGLNCPNCGTQLKIKKGMAVYCTRCGSRVEA
jgi:hypothetical protein